jgi:cardiolipin synthase
VTPFAFRMGLVAIALVVAPILTGCVSDSDRLGAIAADLARDGAQEDMPAYRRDLAALVAQDGLRRFDLENGIHDGDRTAAPVRRRRQTIAALAAPLAYAKRMALPQATAGPRHFDMPWRASSQTLYVAPGKVTSAPFAFSGLQSRMVEIRVVATQGDAFRLTLACDGAIDVGTHSSVTRHPAGMRFTVMAPAQTQPEDALVLSPGSGLERCDGMVTFARGSSPLSLVREETANPGLLAIDSRFDICGVPAGRGESALETAFFAERWLSQTCAFQPGRTVLLDDPRDAFNARVKALLGTNLPERFFQLGNPELPLDFSHAPSLDLIIISYLDIKADFSGRVLDRLLRHHAERGATIRIIASDVLVREKDRAMLTALAAEHHNVQFKTFAWVPPRGATPGERLSRLYKVHHTKLFAALSRLPGHSVAILGGRNIHDGFLFDRPLDLSAFPALQQYGRNRGLTLDYYSNWRDLDVALYGDAAVRALAAHFSTLWFDDARTHVARPFSIAAATRAVRRDGVTRHFISVPYADGHALEDYYVDLIDAARHSIEIVNPYLNLTPRLGAAMEHATTRGVTITIVGRIDLRGDLGGNIVTALNQEFATRYADRITIYDYRDTKLLLHAKILLIDGRLAVISSVNLNNRSFIHDNENGIAVLDSAFYRRAHAVFETYRKAARPVDVRSVPLVWRLLFTSKLVREAL